MNGLPFVGDMAARTGAAWEYLTSLQQSYQDRPFAPQRTRLDEVRGVIGELRGDRRTLPGAWEALASRQVIPASWASTIRSYGVIHKRDIQESTVPPTWDLLFAMASDPEGFQAAEGLFAEWQRRMNVWCGMPIERPVWMNQDLSSLSPRGRIRFGGLKDLPPEVISSSVFSGYLKSPIRSREPHLEGLNQWFGPNAYAIDNWKMKIAGLVGDRVGRDRFDMIEDFEFDWEMGAFILYELLGPSAWISEQNLRWQSAFRSTPESGRLRRLEESRLRRNVDFVKNAGLEGKFLRDLPNPFAPIYSPEGLYSRGYLPAGFGTPSGWYRGLFMPAVR